MFKSKKENKYSDCNKKEKRTEQRSSIETDPLGMYTGVPLDPDEKPVQDADDL